MELNKIKSLSKYLNETCFTPIAKDPLFEAVRNRDIEKALQNIRVFLAKRKIYIIPAIENCSIDSDNCFIIPAWADNGKGCFFVWKIGDTNTLDSVVFTRDFDTTYSSFFKKTPAMFDAQVVAKGASIVRLLQLVVDVMHDKISMDKNSLYGAIKDAQIWESATDEDIEDMIIESADITDLTRRKNNLYQKLKEWEKKGKDVKGLQAEYDKLKAELDDARISVKTNVTVKPANDPELDKIETRFEEEERALPEERFEDMEAYVQNAIDGIDVSVLVCGAPGLGKTFRIMQKIKKAGLQRGMDYEVIKGKCTPLVLYTMLHDYQQRGQLLIIDDADDIITDDTSINLLKAATDSSDERIVSYGTSLAPLVPEEKMGMYTDFEQDGAGKWRYPKSFVYEGSVIIITNMFAGGIDTAIRSRATCCDLNFTTAEVLDIVRKLSPYIAPEILTPESKDKALKYLEDLANSGAPVELSIRSFTLCAKMYLSDAPEKAIERRIKEQMRLKFARGKGRY